MDRRDFIKYGIVAVVGTAFMNPLEARAETIYFGKVKDTKNPAYVVYDTIKTSSKYHSQLPEKNHPDYNKILAKRNDSVNEAIRDVANEGRYDVVVEKDDPKINGYLDINATVIKKIEENEKTN